MGRILFEMHETRVRSRVYISMQAFCRDNVSINTHDEVKDAEANAAGRLWEIGQKNFAKGYLHQRLGLG